MLVSCICLTTHPKRATYLPDALRSFRSQTYGKKELILVNDGAPLKSLVPDIHVINLVDRGFRWTLGEKRNAGIRCANGEYVATWDDDDISFPHRLELQLKFAIEHDADYVLADKMHIANDDMRVMGVCTRTQRPVMPSAMIRRQTLIASGGYDAIDYKEDVRLLEKIRLLRRGHIVVMPADWYVMRRHASNITLGFGEQNDEYAMCGLRGRYEIEAQRQVDAIRSRDGGEDVVEA